MPSYAADQASAGEPARWPLSAQVAVQNCAVRQHPGPQPGCDVRPAAARRRGTAARNSAIACHPPSSTMAREQARPGGAAPAECRPGLAPPPAAIARPRPAARKKATLTSTTKQIARPCAGQVVALGQVVDQRPQSPEIDQELDADDVDQAEHQRQAQPGEQARQARPESTPGGTRRQRRQPEGLRPTAMQHRPHRTVNPGHRLQHHGGLAAEAKAITTTVGRGPAEQHQEQRVGEHQRALRRARRPKARTLRRMRGQ